MKLKSLALVGALVMVAALCARKASAFLSGVVINGSYAESKVLPISLGVGGAQNLGVIVSYSSPSFTAATFTTGQVSTASITIANNAALSTATATDSIVVTSTSGLQTDYISLSLPIPPGAVVLRRSRGDWSYGANTSAAATNIAAALNANSSLLGNVAFVASGNVVYATAPAGALYNNISVNTNATTMTISSPTFLGGLDATDLHVNGYHFKANRDYAIGANANASATNLAAAINSGLSSMITAVASTNKVNLQSVSAGVSFALTTNNSAAASVSASSSYGAQAPSWSLGGTEINIPSHGFVTGLAVLYSTSGSPAITGLTNQTTYYVGVVDANDIALATTAARAASGLFVSLTSSSTLTTAKTYSLSPLSFSAGSAGFNWEVSNDGVNWTLLNVSSLTYTTPGSQAWAFGGVPFSYLGLNLTAPTSGALNITVNAMGN